MAAAVFAGTVFVGACVATRTVVVAMSVVSRGDIFTTTSVVARTGILRVIVAGARAFVAVGVVVGLRRAVAAHFFAWHGVIIIATAAVGAHRTCVVAVRRLRTRDRADRGAIVRASA